MSSSPPSTSSLSRPALSVIHVAVSAFQLLRSPQALLSPGVPGGNNKNTSLHHASGNGSRRLHVLSHKELSRREVLHDTLSTKEHNQRDKSLSIPDPRTRCVGDDAQ